jgi:hypothetical protein
MLFVLDFCPFPFDRAISQNPFLECASSLAAKVEMAIRQMMLFS